MTITAHRGSSAKAPENTLSAIRLAIAEGAHICEVDACEAGDGTIVLLHDHDLRRVTGTAAKVWETPFEKLRDLDFGKWFSPGFEGERIPTLADAIETARGKIQLNIELKYHGREKRFEDTIAGLIRDHDAHHECFITSSNEQGLNRMKTASPGLRSGLIVTRNARHFLDRDVDLLSVKASAVSRDLIEHAHRAGKEVHVWTVNRPEAIQKMIQLDVDSIITDVPALALELLAKARK